MEQPLESKCDVLRTSVAAVALVGCPACVRDPPTRIEPKDLLKANLQRGKVTLLTQDVPRYRVSKQRQSDRARVLEFIVITDTHAKAGPPLRQLLGQLYHFAELGGVDTSGASTQLPLW